MKKTKWKYFNKINYIRDEIYTIRYDNKKIFEPILEYNGKIVCYCDVIENVYTDYQTDFDDYDENCDYYNYCDYSSDVPFYEYCKHTEEGERSIWYYFNEATDLTPKLKKTKDGYILT